jgi:hypothetical protein
MKLKHGYSANKFAVTGANEFANTVKKRLQIQL